MSEQIKCVRNSGRMARAKARLLDLADQVDAFNAKRLPAEAALQVYAKRSALSSWCTGAGHSAESEYDRHLEDFVLRSALEIMSQAFIGSHLMLSRLRVSLRGATPVITFSRNTGFTEGKERTLREAGKIVSDAAATIEQNSNRDGFQLLREIDFCTDAVLLIAKRREIDIIREIKNVLTLGLDLTKSGIGWAANNRCRLAPTGGTSADNMGAIMQFCYAMRLFAGEKPEKNDVPMAPCVSWIHGTPFEKFYERQENPVPGMRRLVYRSGGDATVYLERKAGEQLHTQIVQLEMAKCLFKQ